MNRFLKILSASIPLLSAPGVAQLVDTELVILVDAQSSNRRDFDLILEGVARSFEDPEFQDSVARGQTGILSSSVIFYNAAGQQLVLPWTSMSAPADFQQYADAIRDLNLPRRLGGLPKIIDQLFGGSGPVSTSYGGAILAGAAAIASSAVQGTLTQITLIDDASLFIGVGDNRTRAARDRALASGVDVINAVVFDAGRNGQSIERYYQDNILSDGGSLELVTSSSLGNKSAADIAMITGSIARGISGPTISVVPEPQSALLVCGGLALLAGVRRRARV